MNILITICARKNSKGLPNKHLLPFCGRPLIEWTIDQASVFKINYPNVDIIVSTDSEDILEISKQYDVARYYREVELAKDDTPKLDVLRDALETEMFARNYGYDCVIDLDATNPCRTIEDIGSCLDIFKEKRSKTVISVVKARKNPYFNQLERGGDRWAVKPPKYDQNYTRRQDIPEVFDVNCNIYIYDATWLSETSKEENWNLPWYLDTELYVMPEWTRHDIDNEYDSFDAENNFRKYVLKQAV
jgi:CMP-N-acetylneuraminic acid synthetase